MYGKECLHRKHEKSESKTVVDTTEIENLVYMNMYMYTW